MKKGRGFAASKAQREKVRGLPCVNCGLDPYWEANALCDPAHLWPRGKGGCDHPDCVIPLCRRCHKAFDPGGEGLELLPRLIDKGYWAEMAHPIAAHEVSPNELVKRLTTNNSIRERGSDA